MAQSETPPNVSLITKATFINKLTAVGLDDAQVFEAVRFSGMGDLVSSLFPGVTAVLEPDAEDHAKILLCTAQTRAAFSRRVEDDGLPGGLSDSLWAAGVARKKARKAELAEHPEAFIDKLGRGPAKYSQG